MWFKVVHVDYSPLQTNYSLGNNSKVVVVLFCGVNGGVKPDQRAAQK